MDPSSLSVHHQPFQLYSLRWEFQLDKLPQNDGEEGAGTEGRGNEPVFDCFGLIREKSDYILRSGWKLVAAGKPASRTRRNSRPDEAPSSQVKLKDVHLVGLMDDSAGTPVATEENQVLWEFSASESLRIHEDEVTGEPVAYKKSAEKPAASSISENSGDPKAERKKWPHNFYISSKVVLYMDNAHSIVRKTYDRGPTDEMEDLNVNAAIWWMFMNTILQAAVHLGQDYDQNLRCIKNHFWSSLKKLFK